MTPEVEGVKMNMPINGKNLNFDIIVTDFTDKSAIQFREQVLAKSMMDPSTPIVIYISSYGGYADALASMVETIESVPNKIVTVCQGHAMSCGAILLSFGDYRFIGKHSRVMVHEVSGGAIGDAHDVVADAEEVKRLNAYWLGLMAQNCGFADYEDFREHLKQRDGRNIWLSAKEAVEFGIADYVGLPDIEPVLMHRVMILPDRQKVQRRQSTHSTKKKVKPRTKAKKKP